MSICNTNISYTNRFIIEDIIASINKRDLDKVKYIITNFSINPSYYDNLFIRISSDKNDIEITKFLIDSGVNPGTDGNRIVNSFVRYGNLKAVRYLIEESKITINENEIHPLWVAVNNGYLSITKYLITKCANYFHKNYCVGSCNFSLCLAIKKNYCDVVEYMLLYGANPLSLKKNKE